MHKTFFYHQFWLSSTANLLEQMIFARESLNDRKIGGFPMSPAFLKAGFSAESEIGAPKCE